MIMMMMMLMMMMMMMMMTKRSWEIIWLSISFALIQSCKSKSISENIVAFHQQKLDFAAQQFLR